MESQLRENDENKIFRLPNKDCFDNL